MHNAGFITKQIDERSDLEISLFKNNFKEMNWEEKKNTAVVILAAGLSKRMGRTKAFLPWVNNQLFIEKITDIYYHAGFRKIIIAVNQTSFERMNSIFVTSPYKPIIVLNSRPELGRFYSLQMALMNCPDSNYCFIQNVDNPLINIDIIEILFKARHAEYYTVPVFQERRGHPVLIQRIIMDYILSLRSDNILKDVLGNFRSIEVATESSAILVNINDEEDYKNLIIKVQPPS